MSSRPQDIPSPWFYAVGAAIAVVGIAASISFARARFHNTVGAMRTVAAAMQVSPPPADRDVWSTPQVVAGATVDVQYRPLGPDTYERTFETDERTGRATLAIRDRRLTRLRSDETLSSAALGLVGAGSMTLELVHRDQRAQAVDQWRRDRAMQGAAEILAYGTAVLIEPA